jgi:hypothetical protein
MINDESSGEVTVSGNFSLIDYSQGKTYGVYIDKTTSNLNLLISGNFSMDSGHECFGVYNNYANIIAGSVIISGNFIIRTRDDNNSAGVIVLGRMTDSSVSISGNFAIMASGSNTSTVGVFVSEIIGSTTFSGTPHFYSNKTDSGN